MHTHYCGKRIQDGGVSKGKKTEEKVKKRSESSRMSIAVDAKSDSSVVYTRGENVFDIQVFSDLFCRLQPPTKQI